MNGNRLYPRTSRLTAIVYILGAILGLILSVGGLIGLWTTKAAFTAQAQDTVGLVGRMLEASAGTIQVSRQVLNKTADNLTLTHKMIANLSETVSNSGETLSKTANLVGKDMVDFVHNSQTSLASLQTSAKLLDDFLSVVGRVPFIGRQYKPDVPLEEGFARVSRSMDPLDETFTQMRVDLDHASASASTLKGQLDQLNKQVDTIQTDLDNAQKIVSEYEDILNHAQTRYDRFADRLPGMLNAIYLVITAILIWMLITQVGMLLHGVEMLRLS